jgi:hypothetical protein
MILSELFGRNVVDDAGTRLGHVIDARFVLDPAPGEPGSTARLYGLVVSPHGHSSFGGYARSNMNSPALIMRYMAWRERGAFLVLWPDLLSISADTVTLRPGYTRYSATLVDS